MNNTGLYITWPTSYEALVGRAELKAGMIISLISFILQGRTHLHMLESRRVGSGNCCRWRRRDSCCANCQRSVLQILALPLITYLQLAIALGAKVIAAAGSPEKIEIAKQYGGADHGVNYSKSGWQKEVLALTNGKGVDVIYDPVGLINGS
jgi:NADPH2:quinone reductase